MPKGKGKETVKDVMHKYKHGSCTVVRRRVQR